MPQEFFTSGQVVPNSGIYTVTHAEHRLPHQVTLLEGQRFPACGTCGEAVRFEIARPIRGIQDRREQILLYSLPELENDTDANESGLSDHTGQSGDGHAQKRKPRAKAHRKGGRS